MLQAARFEEQIVDCLARSHEIRAGRGAPEFLSLMENEEGLGALPPDLQAAAEELRAAIGPVPCLSEEKSGVAHARPPSNAPETLRTGESPDRAAS